MINEPVMLSKIMSIMPSLDKSFFKEFFKEHTMEYDLNKSHTRTIMMLFCDGPVPMSHISQRLGLEKGSFTTVANKLISLDMVTKEKSENDKRISLISLTDKGHKFASKLKDEHHEYVQSQLDLLSIKEQDELESAIETLLNSLEIINSRSTNNESKCCNP